MAVEKPSSVRRRIVFRPAAAADLKNLYLSIADEAGHERAGGYLARIEAACMSLETYPARGTVRDRVLPGLRIIPRVAIGTLADVLLVLGLLERLADLIDVRKDDLGLALSTEQGPRRGRSFAAALRKQKAQSETSQGDQDIVDPEGVSF
ncbi:type II toxin-antitoxin system RelE/ParE family toxin [Rhizobium rhizophilum]|uniref:Type II toxin-antitoxin system RelE/ParE family toxin n=2 Tax=Rhizobium rhizophilum TaxID=1850373 RepID=A0ABY2QT68_9HYPH|nr:type II toxin-antitoxin system RelE/ParE family toxin [Rhizobium rhizophilum]